MYTSVVHRWLTLCLFTVLSLWTLHSSAHFVYDSRVGQVVLQADSILDSERASRTDAKHVAIIGGGAAGASAAWHLSKYAASKSINLTITVFEKNPRAGGRARTVDAWNDPYQSIELGASLFVEVNQILVSAMNEFHLAPRQNQDHDENAMIGIWNGKDFVFTQKDNEWGWWSSTKILWKYGLAPIRTQRLMKKTTGLFFKLYDAPFFPFKSLNARVHDLGLAEITAVTGSQYLDTNGISGPFIDHVVQASTRVNYGQNVGVIHGLEAMVCMAIEGTMQIEGGNWRIFEKMLSSSGATVHLNTTVHGIYKKDGTFSVEADIIEPEVSTTSVLSKFDTVILASPLQFSNLSIADEAAKTLPEAIPYVTLHVTLFASPLKLNGEHFNLKASQEMPDTVMTTLSPEEDNTDRKNIVGKAGFFSISTLRSAQNPNTKRKEYIYKIFSPKALTSDFVASIFNISLPGNLTSVPITNPDIISWWYPFEWQSYPYEFPRVTFDDPILAPNLYYTSGIEPFISTMETSALMGKNVARLIADEYRGF